MIIKLTPQSYKWGKGPDIADWSNSTRDYTTEEEINSVTVRQKYGIGYELYTVTEEYKDEKNPVFDGMKMKTDTEGVRHDDDEEYNHIFWKGKWDDRRREWDMSMDMNHTRDKYIVKNYKWVKGDVLTEEDESEITHCESCDEKQWKGTLCKKHSYCTDCKCECDESEDESEEESEEWTSIWEDEGYSDKEKKVVKVKDKKEAERVIMEALIKGVMNVRIQLE